MTIEVESAKVGVSGVLGGFFGWFMSYLTGKDWNKKIEERMARGQCDERHKAIDDWRHESNDRFDRMETKLDDIRELILRYK